MSKRIRQLSKHIYQWEDICNVYLIADGDSGLLIDSGSGTVLDHLGDTGVQRVEWVLHTHHHRDQCQGTLHLRQQGARVAVPEYERHLFEKAEQFWQNRRIFGNYDDTSNFFTVGQNIAVDAVLADYETFAWRGLEFFVLPAKGHTLGSSALIVRIDDQLIAFTGDLMSTGGKLYQLHAMEYEYGSLQGLMFTFQSIEALGKRTVDVCLPAHGEAITRVSADIETLEQRLMDCVNLGRGMRVAGRESVLPESRFLPDPKFVRLSEHLLWGGVWTFSHFYVILSHSGKAMFIDYGHAYWPHMHHSLDYDGSETSMRFIEHHLDELHDDYGVKTFDVVLPTHIHDDHTCGIPHLQRHHGTKCWALEEVGQVLADPAAWASTPGLLEKPIRIDRWLTDGQHFEWEEYELKIFFAPGQTEFHSVCAGVIDGRKVAFTGDNYFMADVVCGDETRTRPYEPTVLRNSFQLSMHRRCAEVMREIEPELICPGHRDLPPCNKDGLDAYGEFIDRKEHVFRQLVAEPADHFIDLFWARLLPYVAVVVAGENLEYRLLLRNNLERSVVYEARLIPPKGWQTTAQFMSLELEPADRGELKLSAVSPNKGDNLRRLMTAEIKIDSVSQGQICEALVTVR